MTAGFDGNKRISSTEIQVTRISKWKQVQSYPLSVYDLSGATINNVVFMTGQYCLNKLRSNHVITGGYDGKYYDNIYKYDAEVDQWIYARNMMSKRRSHAVSVVSKVKVLLNCL